MPDATPDACFEPPAWCRCVACCLGGPAAAPLPLDTSAAPASRPPLLRQLSSRIQLSARSLAANFLARERDPNVSFHRNLLQSEPGRLGEPGAFIEEMHQFWAHDLDALEERHGYIQWLFPIFAGEGLNWRASPLTRAGAAKIRSDVDMSTRVLNSYRMMLSFYGLTLVDPKSGELGRAPNFDERIANLSHHPHNYKRLSRMLTSLGQLGFVRYKQPLLAALQAAIDDGALTGPKAAEAAADFWLPLVYDEGSEWYDEQTLENDSDRLEGCLFQGAPPRAPLPPRPAAGATAALAKRLSRTLSSAWSASTSARGPLLATEAL